MNFDDFKSLVESKRKSNPIWFALDADKKPSQEDYTKVETKLGAKLPLDYLRFINEFGGGYFAFSNVFSLDEQSDFNIVNQNYNYAVIRKGHVLLSENGTGDFYGYKVVNGDCLPQIRFFDHETQQWYETEFADLFEYLERFALRN